MACLNPMLAVKTDTLTANNKPKYRFLSSLKSCLTAWPEFEDDFRSLGAPQWYGYTDKILGQDPKYLVDPSTGEVLNRAVVLPCGQCLGCRTAKAAEWADRILLEAKSYDEVYFVTLTYDDGHVPINYTDDGQESLTLCPRDLTLFFKRLRRSQEYHLGNKIRYYAVGEYGSRFKRPHYHAIIFGLHLPDLRDFSVSGSGRKLHTSDMLTAAWSAPALRDFYDKRGYLVCSSGEHSPIGRVQVDPMTWESAAYCARYTTKKLAKVEDDFYKTFALVPEFSVMSRNPGIAMDYYDQHKEQIYRDDRILIPKPDGVRKVFPPDYYDNLYDAEYPDDMCHLRRQRSDAAANAVKAKLHNFSGSYLEFLYIQEQVFKVRTKSLRRTLE